METPREPSLEAVETPSNERTEESDMAAKVLRGVIVGASTSLGKELSEELNSAKPAWDVVSIGCGWLLII